MKIVINKCYGGFSISMQCAEHMEKLGSKQAKAELAKWRKDKKLIDYRLKYGVFPKGSKDTKFLEINAKYNKEPTFHGFGYVKGFNGYDRTDKYLIAAIEKLGPNANGICSNLEIVEIPDGIEYTIEEYDGMEHIAEKHQTWG